MRTVGSRTRQVQIVQPLNHLVPVAPLPVDPLARRTAPELLVARADCGGGGVLPPLPAIPQRAKYGRGNRGGEGRRAEEAGPPRPRESALRGHRSGSARCPALGPPAPCPASRGPDLRSASCRRVPGPRRDRDTRRRIP